MTTSTIRAAEIRRATGAEIAIHAADVDYLAGRLTMPPLGGLRGRLLGPLLSLWPTESVEPRAPALRRRPGRRTRVHPHPGPYARQYLSLRPTLRAVLCGDALVTRKGAVGGLLPSATLDMVEAMRSVRRLADLDFDVLLSGHGEPIVTEASRRIGEFCRSTDRTGALP